MNKRALIFGLVFSFLVIIFRLVILLGGYTLTKFGFYYSHVLSFLFIVPFYYLAIQQVRDKDYGGIISGKEAIRIALTVFAVSVLILSLYTYIEFNWKFHEIAVQYYNSQDYYDILVQQQKIYPDKLKTENFPAIINEQITSLSAFKATTAKLIPMMFIGLGGAFVMAMMLKRSAN